MLETSQKYELLILLPLNATDEELKAQAGKIEQSLRSMGAEIASSAPFNKGRLAYPIGKISQGYYHLIQFTMEQKAVEEFRKMLLLSGSTTRFNITKVSGFKPFAPMDAQVVEKTFARASADTTGNDLPSQRPPEKTVDSAEKISQPAPSASLVQEKVEPAQSQKQPKVNMEELDKRLEEILGE